MSGIEDSCLNLDFAIFMDWCYNIILKNLLKILRDVLEVDSMGLANGLDVVEWRRTIREVTGFALIY